MAVIRSLNSETGTASIGGKVIMIGMYIHTLINVERFAMLYRVAPEGIPFIIPFDGIIKLVSTTIHGEGTVGLNTLFVRIYINGVLAQEVTTTTYSEVLEFNVSCSKDDELTLSMAPNSGSDRTTMSWVVLEEV